MTAAKRCLITSALPYINGVKHLGNLAGSLLPADIYARFQRQTLGVDKVLFICATDEHGTPAELAAIDEGTSVQDYCVHWHQEQSRIYQAFGLSFDWFGRSSSPQNRHLTQLFAQKLWEQGFLEERITKQVYSNADKRFLPDRYIIGTCPHCGYDRARGDQCENCTRVLDPENLLEARSALSGSTDIEIKNSKHLFLKQTSFESELRQWVQSKANEWPSLVTSIAFKWLDEGLQDRGITRDLQWGVPVNAGKWGANPDGQLPDVKGLAGKVFYVWFDAPIEYIGATWEWADAQAKAQGRASADDADWQRWWKGPAASDVTYVEFMGKDNVPFHTVGFPCTIMGVNKSEAPDQAWKLVDNLKGFNWLNYYGGKFSTSLKCGIFMDAALELFPADYWRWYLTANAPEGSDASFAWEHFAATVNKDLADVFGNFINRILKFAASRFDQKVPEGGAWTEKETALAAALEKQISQYTDQMENMQFRRAAAELRAVWVLGNEYMTDAAPWSAIKVNPGHAAVSVRVGINLARIFAVLSSPIIPETASRVLDCLGVEPDLRSLGGDVIAELQTLLPGHHFTVPDVLFQKIDDQKIAELIEKFSGRMDG